MGVANRTIRSSDGAVLPLWEFLGGEAAVVSGQSAELVAANLPDDTVEIIHISAEGGAVYYSFSPIASALSPGYVAENQRVVLGPIRDLYTLGFSFYLDTGVTAHVEYYRENRGR